MSSPAASSQFRRRSIIPAALVVAGMAGCSATTAPGSPAHVRHGSAPRVVAAPDRAPIDPIAALTPDAATERSWVVPGPIQLELGGIPVSGAPGRPIEVAAFDRLGNLERVAVRLEHARFSVWIDRAHLLSVLARDQRIGAPGATAVDGDVEVVLRAGTRVRRIAHRNRFTRIRYLGAVQVEGWVPDAALRDRGRPRDGIGRIPTGRKTLMVIPGAVIRAAPRWDAGALAIMATGYFVDTIRDLDEAWSEVGYEDGDVAVHGFVSRKDPPGRLHQAADGEPVPVLQPSAAAASGTCLYAREGGDAIGYLVGNRPVELDDAGRGWWRLAIDTPWGPLAFAARGAVPTDLVACAPPGAVPAVAATAPAAPAPGAP